MTTVTEMPTVEDKNETEDDDMEQETPESDKSDEEESETGTASDDEADTSEMDEEECERRRDECMDDMSDLEKQFSELREQLYRERIAQVEDKLEEVKGGKALEYLTPLQELQENMRIRTQVAGIWRELELINIKHKFESEETAANQNFESEKTMLYDSVKEELEEKIRRLEEDRHNIDIHSDLWESQTTSRKNKKKRDPFSLERRRKPITVTGPYVVYMLKDMEIIEDWTVIKKALKQMPRKKSEYF